jgi:hypothetical protein
MVAIAGTRDEGIEGGIATHCRVAPGVVWRESDEAIDPSESSQRCISVDGAKDR